MSGKGVAEEKDARRPMTVQVLRTKAETALTEEFAANESRLPGGAWVKKMRREAIGAFSALGLPHRRLEAWKYTDLRGALKDAFPVAAGEALRSDRAAAETAVAGALPGAGLERNWAVVADGAGFAHAGLVCGPEGSEPFLSRMLEAPPAWVKEEIERAKFADDAMLALNGAFFTDGIVLDIPAGAELAEPLLLLDTSAKGGKDGRKSVFLRNVIRVGNGAKVTLVEVHAGASAPPRQTNVVTHLIVGDGAEVEHVRRLEVGEGSTLVETRLVTLGKQSIYRPCALAEGEGLARAELRLTFAGEGSELDLAAAVLADRTGHVDTTLVIDHAVPGCRSRELFKGVLDGEARAVFQGKVIVRPGAQKTDGKQMAQALLLSPSAEFDSKPELEIYADDVVCGHGSTSSDLDEDLLFYCRSRGIPLSEARALLVELFIGEAIDKVAHAAVREALMALVRRRLAEGGTALAA